jgi:isobutyryl-CoA mutase
MSNSPANKVRIVTAASLFDGHDAAINIMRRIMQNKGAEIIHLGHNRSVKEIVEAAIEEDAHGIAITSYQGGHVEFFKYMKDLLVENGCGHIKIFGGGGGTILPAEIEELHNYGITKIYSPDDGRHMGLEGMIEDVIKRTAPPPPPIGGGILEKQNWNGKLPLDEVKDIRKIARAITHAENGQEYSSLIKEIITQNEFSGPPLRGAGGLPLPVPAVQEKVPLPMK